MSAFKRYQSKVFWNQMAARDLEDDYFVGRNDPPRYCFNERLREKEKNEEEEEEEDSISKLENDTIDGANITAIRVCGKNDEESKQDASRISLKRDESVACSRYAELTNLQYQILHILI